jgi:magnesium transporter
MREALRGIVRGIVLVVVGVGHVFIEGDRAEFALSIGPTRVSIAVMGCAVGPLIPLALRRAKVDPATRSTPFVSTTVEVLGIVIDLCLAQVLLAPAIHAAPAH